MPHRLPARTLGTPIGIKKKMQEDAVVYLTLLWCENVVYNFHYNFQLSVKYFSIDLFARSRMR
jgi:hypothetical protein